MLLPRPTFCAIQISSVFVSTNFCPNEKKALLHLQIFIRVYSSERGKRKKNLRFFFFVLGKNAFGASAVLPIAAAALVFLWILKSRVGLFRSPLKLRRKQP